MNKEKQIKEIEKKVLENQKKDFQEWLYWFRKLEAVDPHNKLLEIGFHGLPMFGFGGD